MSSACCLLVTVTTSGSDPAQAMGCVYPEMTLRRHGADEVQRNTPTGRHVSTPLYFPRERRRVVTPEGNCTSLRVAWKVLNRDHNIGLIPKDNLRFRTIRVCRGTSTATKGNLIQRNLAGAHTESHGLEHRACAVSSRTVSLCLIREIIIPQRAVDCPVIRRIAIVGEERRSQYLLCPSKF